VEQAGGPAREFRVHVTEPVLGSAEKIGGYAGLAYDQDRRDPTILLQIALRHLSTSLVI